MLDIKLIERDPDVVKTNNRVRGSSVDVDQLLDLERQRKGALVALENARAEIKRLSALWRGKPPDEASERLAENLKRQDSENSEKLRALTEELHPRMSWLPNVLDPRVPIGDENANQTIRTAGTIPEFDFPARSHEELGELLNLIDIPHGVKVAKSRFYNLKNEAVLMRLALIRMFVNHVRPQGFDLICPPFMAKDRSLFASGYLPFSSKDNFRADEDLSLIGTSEQALLGMHVDETLTKLPLLYLGDSMCFRTEAGSYGRDVAGILRVHQFYKLEQFVYCHPDESEQWHLRCLENEEWIAREVGVPYRVVITSSGDLGAPGRMKYDTEGWFPSQDRYRELTSNTNLWDYQTRRGNIRYKIGSDKGFPHTISATGFCDRLILAILENFQNKDGSVRIPDRLVPYLDGLTCIQRK